MVKFVASIVACVALTCITQVLAFADESQARIYLAVVNCAGNASQPVAVTLSLTRAGTYRHVAMQGGLESNGARVYTFAAPANLFWLNVQDGKCYDNLPIIVVPGHTRHVYAFLSRLGMLTYSEDGWVDGCLPAGAGNVGLRFPGGRPIAIPTIDDGCYYMPIPAPGTYELDVSPHPGMVLRLSLDLRSIGPQTIVRRDITMRDFEKAFIRR